MSQTVKKADFVKAFLTHGLGYAQANAAYGAMLSVVEQSILDGHEIRLGHVGTLVPVESDPRKVKMGFRREKGKVVKCHREFILGRRVQYKFRLHRVFMRRSEFKWFAPK